MKTTLYLAFNCLLKSFQVPLNPWKKYIVWVYTCTHVYILTDSEYQITKIIASRWILLKEWNVFILKWKDFIQYDKNYIVTLFKIILKLKANWAFSLSPIKLNDNWAISPDPNMFPFWIFSFWQQFYVVQVDLKLLMPLICLSPSPNCWDYRSVPLH